MSAPGRRIIVRLLLVLGALLGGAETAIAQSLITAPISESDLTPLPGNTRFAANAANDRGIVPNAFPMQHMLLQLRRPAAKEQALAQFMKEQQDPASPNYQRWLTAREFGANYGPSSSDVRAVAAWLESHGFRVNADYPSGMTIAFSGTAGQVRAAFHTEIHHIFARGALHFANMSDPLIPSALAPAVVGIVSLNDIKPRPQFVKRTNYTTSGCTLGTCYAVTPRDLATIYNFKPVFAAGDTGQGQTIYLIEDTDLYSTADWTTFRSTFGLSGYKAPLVATVHPAPASGPTNCSDPGVNGDDGEAILDAEYASAAAPSAKIVMATCSAHATFGGLIAIENLIDGAGSPPKIISMSYGECEADNGAASNAAYNSIFEQGAAEGTSIFVSAGDQDAGSCDSDQGAVLAGISVNALASTPHDVAVGGTDFSDTYAGANGVYWNASNTAIDGSALSYIPEIPWNSSCASQLFAYYFGYGVTYGASGFCNSGDGTNGYLTNGGGSGGPSGCATGVPSQSAPYGNSVVSGSCAGYAKPSWQTGVVGIPSDGVRDLPDVSLFAADGGWDHYYVYCYSDADNGGSGCVGAPNNWNSAGGTSFAAPIMAGIQALINQKTGKAAGNPNPRMYQLAAIEQGTGGGACNSSLGVYQSSWCIFHNITQGDNDADCQGSNYGTFNCYLPSGSYGVLSTSNSAYQPAYAATPGWSFATGLGSVNVANLVANWSAISKHWWSAGTGGFFGAGDSNGILWRERLSGDVSTWKLNGAERVAVGGGETRPEAWTIVGVGDFFATGRSDSILWRNATTGEIQTWKLDGATVSATGAGQTEGAEWTVAGIGDFFASGHADSILWRNTATGQISTWELKGATIVATGGGQPQSNEWTVAGIGDFFASGHADSILWRNTFNGEISTWRLNGENQLATGGGQSQSNVWAVAGIGDFFASGRPDSILWRNVSTGQISTWQIDGVAVNAKGGGQTQAPVWDVAGIGDFFHTGHSDSILWRHGATGQISTWEMNGVNKVAVGAAGLIRP